MCRFCAWFTADATLRGSLSCELRGGALGLDGAADREGVWREDGYGDAHEIAQTRKPEGEIRVRRVRVAA
jgi:hypothetical protein